MSALYTLVYNMSLPALLLLGVSLLAAWTSVALRLRHRFPRGWRAVCATLVAVCVYLIYAGTLRGRGVGNYDNYFFPFQVIFQNGFSLQYVREMVLNGVLFAPLGATLSFALPEKYWWLCLPVATTLSLAVEILQSSLRLGYFQTDDLLYNTLGCLVGAIPFLLCRRAESRQSN